MTQDKQPVQTDDERYLIPDVDIYEKDNVFILVADMPGVGEKDLDVSVEDDILTIVGRVASGDSDAGASILDEYTPASYRRLFQVSRDLNHAAITGKMTNGVLRLELPKSEEAKVRKIPIQSE